MFETPRDTRPAIAASGDAGIGAAPSTALAPLAQIDFTRVRSVIWGGRAIILGAAAAALVLAILFVLIAPHKFTAVTQILIDPSDLNAVANETTPAAPASDAAVLQVESQVQVITSDIVLRRVVDSQELAKDPEFAGRQSALRVLADDILSIVGMRNEAIPGDKSIAALTELKRDVQVKRAERTYVVSVAVTTREPAKSARLANAIAQAYLAEQTEMRADAARQVSQSLSARLKDLQDRVRDSEEKAEAFKARNNMVGANGQLVSDQQLSELNNQLGLARARTAEAKSRLDQVQLVQRTNGEIGAFPEAVQSPTITALRSQYAEVMRREAEQMTTLGARHPAVIEIEAQADRLQHMIEDEVKRIAVSARSEYEAAKANEETLGRNLDTLKHTALNTNEAMVGLRELEREVQANRAVYEAYLVRARETGEQAGVDTKNIRVISIADLPLRRSSPPSSLLIALAALILGTAAGVGIVLVRAPSIATSPADPDGRSRRPQAASLAAPTPVRASQRSIPVLAVLPAVDVSFGLNAVDDPHSAFARGIRNVYAAVRSSHHAGVGPSLMVVASDDQDDTAAVVLTLAAMAAATQRVLLIDADMKRRTLSAIDADQGAAGLVDVAVGRRMLADVITRDRETNINLVPFITPQSRRDRNISDADVERAFDQTRRFDMVIVAANNDRGDPSTRFFAGLVDHIVLVAAAGERGEAAIEQCVTRLGAEAAKLRGTVLTGAAA